ncbi:hypothetical protein [Desulfatitalea tepidiphila]|uniref:hypothetical protein n=1 Tax=Desulfatitalea tepidiphila TaxID=1185843 RepID=UPI0006B57DE4|nr:hypothetical protein [Desulfatitalea tepidiphila]
MTMDHVKGFDSELRTWMWLVILLGLILFKGFFAFFVVSDLGQPTWSYRPVADVPASSPYAEYQLLPYPQHIRGAKGE